MTRILLKLKRLWTKAGMGQARRLRVETQGLDMTRQLRLMGRFGQQLVAQMRD